MFYLFLLLVDVCLPYVLCDGYLNCFSRARHSIETERPSKASKRSVDQKGGKQTRHSLEPKKTTRPAQAAAQAAKRKSNPEVTAEGAVLSLSPSHPLY